MWNQWMAGQIALWYSTVSEGRGIIIKFLWQIGLKTF